MLTEKDASRAYKLFNQLSSREESLMGLSSKGLFYIGYEDSTVRIPVASDIAKQIGYNYYNEEIYKIKQELADMGFSCEEKKEPVQEPFKAVLYSEELLKREVAKQERALHEDLDRKYEKVYGKWPKEEASEDETP